MDKQINHGAPWNKSRNTHTRIQTYREAETDTETETHRLTVGISIMDESYNSVD